VSKGLADAKKISGKLAHVQANRRTNESLNTAAERLGMNAQELGEELAEFYQMPFIELNDFEIDQSALNILSAEQCKKYCVMPLSKAGTTLVVAFADPTNLFMRDDIS
jgi:type IV pilus assembly protein PilB